MQFTQEQWEKVTACKSAQELIELAKAEGITLSPEAAEKYLAQFSNPELNVNELDTVAGGCFYNACAGDICANLC